MFTPNENIDHSFEQNRKQIQQTHEIINVIESKLNNFLQMRGIGSPESLASNQRRSAETYLLGHSQFFDRSSERIMEMKIEEMGEAMGSKAMSLAAQVQQLEMENKQLKAENETIANDNTVISQQAKEHQLRSLQLFILNRLQSEIDQQIVQQRSLMQKNFDIQMIDVADRAKQRLIEAVKSEEGNLTQYNEVMEQLRQLSYSLQQLRSRNEVVEEEKNELSSACSNLLQMHNQMLKVDVHNPTNQLPSNTSVFLNRYRQELEGLRHNNQTIQEHMNQEVMQLRNQLTEQKHQNAELIKSMSSMNQSEEGGSTINQQSLIELYQQGLLPESPQDKENCSPQPKKVTKKKTKSQSGKSKIQDQQIQEFQNQLQELKTIVKDKILSKKQKQQK